MDRWLRLIEAARARGRATCISSGKARPRGIERWLRLLFPPGARCAGCRSLLGADGWFCDECRERLVRRPSVTPPKKARPAVYAAFHYDGVIRGAIGYYKFAPVRALEGVFGDELVAMCEALRAPRPDVVIPVPLHPSRERERGFNQSRLLAERLSRHFCAPLSDGLVRTRRTRQQSLLSPKEREQNTKGAFKALSRFDGLRVWLVDDVVTTGSTVSACAQALRKAGADEVCVICVAQALQGGTRKPDPPTRKASRFSAIIKRKG